MTSVFDGHKESGQPLEKLMKLLTAAAEKHLVCYCCTAQRSYLLYPSLRVNVPHDSPKKQKH